MSCCFCSISYLQLFLVILIVLFIFYKWSTSTFGLFTRLKIPFDRPVPLLGNFAGMMLGKESIFEVTKNLYLKHKNAKIYGTYHLRDPVIAIADTELIKQMGVRDFDVFPNHSTFIAAEDAPMLGNSLFLLKDQKWKDMRATLSPAFTGNKLRHMFQFVLECSRNCCGYLKDKTRNEGNLDLDVKEFFTRFTTDVIASTAFGLEINSLKEMDNEFFHIAQRGVKFSFVTTVKIFMYMTMKRVMRFFDIKVVDKTLTKYFNKVVLDAIEYRLKNGIIRPDIIHLLMQARQGTLIQREADFCVDHEFAAVEESNVDVGKIDRKWSDDDIVAQCFLFFLAGYATSSSVMCFCAHEIMANPDVQKKLITEIDQTRTNLKGRPITYEDLQKMKYLDMVLCETLRKWPPNVTTDRVCSKLYKVHNEYAGEDIEISRGQRIEFPIVGLHYDPEFWRDPERFDPERFSDENRQHIKSFTYLPFGVGPRNCIGSRFALMEIKAILYHLLSEFTLERSAKTSIPLVLLGSGFQYDVKGGFWMQLKSRNT